LNEEGFFSYTYNDKGFAFVGFTNSFGSGGYDAYLVKTDSMAVNNGKRPMEEAIGILATL